MLRRTLLTGQGAFRRTSSALICAAGLGAAGCAGNHLDLSSRLPWSARGAETRVADERAARTQAAEEEGKSDGGRVFSAFVDRMPGRKSDSHDPFLEESVASASRRAAASGDFSAVPPVRSRTPVQAAARTSAPQVAQGRSDEELWRLFNEDAGAARVASPAPAPQQSLPAPTPQRSVAARTTTPGTAALTPSTPPRRQVVRPPVAQTSAPSTAPASPSGAGPRPMPKLVAEAAPPPRQPAPQARPRVESPAPQASGPVARQQEAEQRLARLMAEARQFQAQGALFDAYRTAIVAEQFAERAHLVFAPRQPQPSDLVRELEAQMQAQRAAALPVAAARPTAPQPTAPTAAASTPPSTAARSPERARTVTVTRSRPADPFADDHAAEVAQPWKGATSAPPRAQVADGREPFSTNFPPLHEWRGVRANSPVSLTVSNSRTPAESEAALPEFPVKQAVATQEPAESEQRQAPLLARVEADRRQLQSQGTSLFGSGPQRGAPKGTSDARRPEAPLQTADAADDASPRSDVAVAGPTLAKPASSRGSLVWWTLGLLALLTGGIALRSKSSAHDD